MGAQSGFKSCNCCCNSGSFVDCGLKTGSPASSATSATGDGRSFLPRPTRASGRVKTPTTSWEELRSAFKDGTATSGVPANNKRMALSLEGLYEFVRVELHPQRSRHFPRGSTRLQGR